MNTHSVNDDETDIDALETLTTSHTSLIAVNNALITTNQNNIATHESEINALQTLTNTHESEINTIQSNELFTDIIKFRHNGFFAMSGGNLTGSAEAASTELGTAYKRIIPNISDTYSSNIALTDSNTKFIMNESGTYLCSYSLEIYDNASDVKIIQFGLHDDINGVPKFNFRNTIHPSGTGYEYYTFSGSCILTLQTGNDGYYFQIKSSGGGKLSTNITTEFTLIKINKSF
jgi:hypothetical protein